MFYCMFYNFTCDRSLKLQQIWQSNYRYVASLRCEFFWRKELMVSLCIIYSGGETAPRSLTLSSLKPRRKSWFADDTPLPLTALSAGKWTLSRLNLFSTLAISSPPCSLLIRLPSHFSPLENVYDDVLGWFLNPGTGPKANGTLFFLLLLFNGVLVVIRYLIP